MNNTVRGFSNNGEYHRNPAEEGSIELFVSGRLCMFGEHSDWAGQLRKFNSGIEPGNALVCGTEQGLFARASRSTQLKLRTVLPYGEIRQYTCDMDEETLRRAAREDNTFAYIVGVAAYLSAYYVIGGLNLDIYKMTLPIKKGLSSSAAVCVLTARAFNKLYNLNLTTRGEMEIAYHGEQLTPSRCGRLDQACAYGKVPVHLRFDGDRLDVKPLHVKRTMYWVFADLCAKKDTIRILSDLNSAYPYPNSDKDKKLHSLLGEENRRIVDEAIEAISKGNARRVGELMSEAQRRFDEIAAPFSPVELKAERLHKVLGDPIVRGLSFGGKGVGSQGDGCVQFIAKDARSGKDLVNRLSELGCTPYSITLEKSQLVRRAVIPAAGFGTRMYPVTKVINKELLPVVDSSGEVKPALLVLLEELDAAGIEQIALIIRPGTRDMYKQLFAAAAGGHKLSKRVAEYEQRLCAIGEKIEYIEQGEQLGFGHAIWLSQRFSREEPVLVCLGDHIYASNTSESCTRQLIDCYETHRKTVASITEIPLEDVGLYGVASGCWEPESRVMQVDRFDEKPSEALAREELGVLHRSKVKYFAFFGQYILEPKVYGELNKAVEEGRTEQGEYQLTSALDAVRKKEGALGFHVNGRRFDIGVPEQYKKALLGFLVR